MKLILNLLLLLVLTSSALAQFDVRTLPETQIDMTGSGSLLLPKGSDATRPSTAIAGMARWNTTSGSMEVYDGSTWTAPIGTTANIDSTFSLLNLGDPTKILKFSAQGITAGTTRTLTSPDADGVLPLLGLAQTFSAVQTFSDDIIMSGTGQLKIPEGTTLQRSGAPTTGMLRWNSDLGFAEIYDGAIWSALSPADKISGPASATDNAIVRYDTTSGKLAQDSGVTIDDTNNMSTTGDLKVGAGTSLEFDLILSLYRARMTGVAEPNGLTIDGGGTTFGINATEGQIVDFDAQTYDVVSYAGSTGNAPATANGVTYIYLDVAGAISTTTTSPTPSERREKLYLGRAITVGGTIVQVLDEPVVTENAAGSIYDLAKAIRIFNEEGNLITANGANLNLNKSVGKVFSVGANYTTDRNNPHRVNVPACTACTFAYITQAAGSTQAATALFDPANYDVSGTITAIPGANKTSTIQRLYLFPSGAIRIAYGQTTYSDLTTALQNLSAEVHVDNPAVFGNGILFALIVARKDATDLSNSAHARILYPSRFGESAVGAAGQSVSSLQDAYNNSTDGEIVLDAVNTSVEIRDALTPIASPLLEILSNDSLTSYFSVSASGTTIEDITIADSVITDNTQDTLWFQNAVGATSPASFAIASDRASANDDTALFLYGRGKSGAITNSEFLELRWNTASSDYTIETGNTGTGTLYPLEIRAGSANANQLLLNTDGSIDVAGNLTMNGTGAIKVPEGTTAQRPTPATGMFRFNSTLSSFEGYDGSVWGEIGGGDLTEVYADTTDGLLFLNATQQGISIRDTSGGVGGGLLSVDSFDGSSNYWSVSTSGMQLGTGAVVSTILDEDDMASDSASALATQQSVKAYVDDQVARVPINYILNGGFEEGAAGWNRFDDGSAYVDGTGGTSLNVVTAFNAVSPLRETQDFKFTQGAVVSPAALYEGVSYDFTIDKGVRGELLQGSFFYDTSDADYVSRDIRIYIYDITNANIIEVSNPDIKKGSGIHYFEFETVSTSDSYRISFMVNQENTTGYAVYFDQLVVSPLNQPSILALNAVTDPVDFTPVFTGFVLGNGTTEAYYARSGKFMSGKIDIVVGTTTTFSGLEFDIPNGHSIEPTDTYPIYGGANFFKTGSNWFPGFVFKSTDNKLRAYSETGSPVNAATLTSTVPFTWAAGDTITLVFNNVPIQGWTSSVSSVVQNKQLTAETANELSARISNNGSVAAVESSNYSWVDSATWNSLGVVTIDYTSLGLTEIPSYNATTFNSGGATNYPIRVSAISNTAITFVTFDTSNNRQDVDFSLKISKQGADVNTSQVIAGTFEGINSTDLVKVNATNLVGATSSTSYAYNYINSVTEIEDNYNALNDTGDIIFTAPRDSYYSFDLGYRTDYSVGANVVECGLDGANGVVAVRNTVSTSLHLGKCIFNSVFLTEGQAIRFYDRKEGSGTVAWDTDARFSYLRISELPDTESIIKNLNDNNNVECETKYLSADISSNTDPISDLTFTSVVGKKYSIDIKGTFYSTATSDNRLIFSAVHNGGEILRLVERTTTTGTNQSTHSDRNSCFMATGTSFTFKTFALVGTMDLQGDGSGLETHATICKLPDNTICN